ncbi:hypothetical protein KP77_20820 [Jeotgalibacillus alimentarius]|uniref:HD domain-containing protein n=1 Tax=Jeotgalibacillus alimentarius TaxID=135826 RepID=A0A0C2VWU2_9BACL|nr:HD domain-containing protein [Jeotgalibacillus alimentarius]KIL48871.1 hypothetical protein KP77_20820 [Jeotgalibacillus alimentarius]
MINISHHQLIKAEQQMYLFHSEDRTGHGWDHILRVKNLALKIAEIEGVQQKELVELISLFHDAGDDKLHPSTEEAADFLNTMISLLEFSPDETDYLIPQIKAVSFRNRDLFQGGIESQIVADADRLDAIGAIGAARAFTYGGAGGQKLYSVKSGEPSVLDHFDKKLLKLKDTINTKTGYKIALERHRFLEQFKDQFLNEWNGKK